MTDNLNARPVVLTFAGHYLPGFKGGGPIRTLANMVDQLGNTFDFRIVAADRDLGDSAPFADQPINTWTPVGGAQVFYCSPGWQGWQSLLASKATQAPDLIYLNSFFSPGSSIWPLLHRRLGGFGKAPVLLAARGEFSPGALSLKPIKKRVFILVSQLAGLHANVMFQASSEFEAGDIRRVFLKNSVSLAVDMRSGVGNQRIAVARNLSGRSENRLVLIRERRAADPLRLVFLARLAPMKNLLGAIDILSRVGDTRVDFDIYGVMEDAAYWARCQAAIATLPGNIRVEYKGPLRPDEVETVLARYDAFLFPTLGENYGHVIREALSAGLPVLVSDRTPWRGLAEKGAGADLPLEAPHAFADRIVAWAGMAGDDFQKMREAARDVGDDPVAAQAALNANREMFLAALRKTA